LTGQGPLPSAERMEFLPADLADELRATRRRWLVTGAAGFIGSNLVECLLAAGQDVVGLDNFATGYQRNVDEAEGAAGSGRLTMIAGDIRDRSVCAAAVDGVDIVLHQAALGSVPRSLADPLTTHDTNVTGFLNMLEAARTAGVARFIYAASSSTYGDEPNLPKIEDRIGRPLSPYAATKLADEIYANVYDRSYGFKATGLRYFNVFGPRQDPDGAYAAVIPKWVGAMLRDEDVSINGPRADAQGEVFNVAVGARTSLNQLFTLIRDGLREHQVHYRREPVHVDFRPGDVRHSQADIGKARRLLGYAPTHGIEEGMKAALPWYIQRFG
jgi:UDP-N-acetylglucosamine/UDP-N-acetylgalactosamine 4-epimerase